MLRNDDGSLACICHEHKPECDCVPMAADLIEFAATGAPPLAPEPFSPNDTQSRFMWLHERHFVTVWKWLWQGATFRAFTDRGVTVSINKGDVAELVEHGLMRWGTGYIIELTDLGREWCAKGAVTA